MFWLICCRETNENNCRLYLFNFYFAIYFLRLSCTIKSYFFSFIFFLNLILKYSPNRDVFIQNSRNHAFKNNIVFIYFFFFSDFTLWYQLTQYQNNLQSLSFHYHLPIYYTKWRLSCPPSIFLIFLAGYLYPQFWQNNSS